MAKYNGTANDDLIKGSNKSDMIYGMAGDDELYGRKGHDEIYGGQGHDSIYGGAGVDELWGGNGKDSFYFYENDTGRYEDDKADTVMDFTKKDTLYIYAEEELEFGGKTETPDEGEYSVWKNADKDWVVTYNVDGDYHDIVVNGVNPTKYIEFFS